jgi:hypothetical protein
MLISYHRGQTSVVLRVKILNSSVSTGAGLTGLTNSSSGLIISTIADNESSATTYTAGGSTIDTIATLGTFATPTASHCRFKEVDSTNHKGVYEIQLDNTRYAVSSAKSLLVSISGATNAAETDCVIPLLDTDPYDGAAGGMSRVDAAISSRMATFTLPTNFSSLSITGGGAVTAGTVSDKTGYSLTQSFPSNFSSLAITVGGAVTAGTVSDKTGYSLSSSQTFNVTGNITGNLTGSVGSVTGAVGSVTGNVGGNVVGSVASVTAGVTVSTNNDKTGYSLAANQHVIVDSGTVTTVSGQLTAYSSGTGIFSVAALANAPSGGGGGSDPWSTSMPGSYTGSQAGALFYAMTNEVAALQGAAITYAGPVATGGTVSLVRGDDYKNTDGRALVFTNAAGSWANLTSASVTFTVLQKSTVPNSTPITALMQSGTVVTPSGSNQQVRFDLTAAETLLPVGLYSYSVTAVLSDGSTVTLSTGNCYVTQGSTP